MADVLSFKPKDVTLELYANDDAVLDMLITDSLGQSIDVSGWTGDCVFRTSAGAQAVAAAFSVDVVDGPTGRLRLVFDSNATTVLTNNGDWNGRYDVQLIDSGGSRKTPFGGGVSVTKDVTR